MTTCRTCIFFSERNFDCHFSPPVRLPRKFSEDATAGNRVRDEQVEWGWPVVGPDDWCGSWHGKPATMTLEEVKAMVRARVFPTIGVTGLPSHEGMKRLEKIDALKGLLARYSVEKVSDLSQDQIGSFAMELDLVIPE